MITFHYNAQCSEQTFIFFAQKNFSMLHEARKLSHFGIRMMPWRCTLSDANDRHPKCVFEKISTAHADAEACQEDMAFLGNGNDSLNNAHYYIKCYVFLKQLEKD